MSCGIDDKSCETPRRRGALAALGLMTAIFIFLSYVSFLPSRGQVTPDNFSYGEYSAIDGKRVFQAYNCMGCHTLVGNGAYLGPDLTNVYADTGPAYLAAFLPSAGSWPTENALRAQLQDAVQREDSGIDSIDAYLAQYSGVQTRIERRSGQATTMPNLPLTKDEIGQLIAYLKYTSTMNTEGWPPTIKVAPETVESHRQKIYGFPAPIAAAAAAPLSQVAAAPAAAMDPAALGAQLVKDYACTACHANDKTALVGPGWGGLYGSQVTLEDGSKVTADEAYLTTAITQPDVHLVAGYPVGVMPSYEALLSSEEVAAIVAHLRTLETQ